MKGKEYQESGFMKTRNLYNILINSNGQTLIEAVASLGIAALILGTLSIAVINSVKNVTFSKGQNIASNYAQQGLELIRDLRDSDISTFRQYGNIQGTAVTYCLAKNTSASAVLPTKSPASPFCDQAGQKIVELDNTYIREVTIQQDSSDCLSSSVANLTPTPTPSSTGIIIDSRVTCDASSPKTPNEMCRDAGYSRAILEPTSNLVANGYFWPKCSESATVYPIATCTGMTCTVLNVNDCIPAPQWTYPTDYNKSTTSHATVYLPDELGGDCSAATKPGWRMRVYCEQLIAPTAGPTPNLGRVTKAIVSVYWKDSKCSATSEYCHKVSLTSCLTESNTIPAP